MIRSGDAAKLPGTRIQNRCVVTSVGLDSMDGLMGGGLPMHNLYLLSETLGQKFGPYFLRYFVAEGISQNQKTIVVGRAEPEYLHDIPSCSKSQVNDFNPGLIPEEDMTIAWRYSSMPSMNSGLSAQDKKKFDLTTKVDISTADLEVVVSDSYKKLYEEVAGLLQNKEYIETSGKKMLRLIVNDFGSPLFEDSGAAFNFISKLKVLLLHLNAVCMVYVHESLFELSEIDKLVTISDVFFRLEPHDENLKRDLGLEDSYDGRFHIVKLPHLNSFATKKPACVDLVFERHRHYLEVKMLHLPAVMGGADMVKSACQTIANSF